MKKKSSKKHSYNIYIILMIIFIGSALGAAAASVLGVDRVKEIHFRYPECAIYEGQSVNIPAETSPMGLKLSYTSENENIARVDGFGMVTGNSAGETNITAFDEKTGKKATLRVIVKKIKLVLNTTDRNLELEEGESRQLDIMYSMTGSEEQPLIEYSSSDENVASVTPEGKVTAVGEGEAVIRAYNSRYGAGREIKVTVSPSLKYMAFSEYRKEIDVNEKYIPQLIFTPENIKDKQVELTVSDEKTAQVDEEGALVGKAAGTVTVKAVHKASGKTASMTVTVRQPVSGIQLDKTNLELTEGSSGRVKFTVLPENAYNRQVEISLSDRNVASAKETDGGEISITGLSQGSCTVRVTSKADPDIFEEVQVRVSKKPEPVKQKATYIKGILVVNKTYGLPKDYNEDGGLTPETKAAFEEMRKAAAKDSISLRVSSGYRSYSYQKSLFERYLRRPGQSREYVESYSARPGHSEHQAGVAIDVNTASMAFLGTPAQKWLEKHCVEYGFIIRYPEGKQQYTGFQYEPWHVRYLGKETARAVSDSGLCLEEYLGITSEYAD